MKDKVELRVGGLFFVMLAVLAGVAWHAINTIGRAIDKAHWVNHVHEVIIDVNGVLSDLHAGDAALSQYVLTGDARDQTRYRTEYGEMVATLEAAKALTRRDPTEAGIHKQVLTLEKLLTAHIAFTRSMVQARQTGGLDAARQVASGHPVGQSTADIRKVVADLNADEDGILSQRDQEARTEANNTKYVVYTGVILNFGLLVFVSVLIRSDLKSRRIAATAMEEANAQLEAKVQERTAELVKSNQALKKENLERRWSYQALDHQFRYNQLIINAISEMVFVVSKVLNISRVNPPVTHISGWQPEDLVTQSIDKVLQIPVEGGPSNPLIAALNEGREIQERPATIITKAGASIQVRFNLVPLRDDNKVVGGVVTVRPWQVAPQKPG